jgi:hypothetical protein
MAIPTLLELVVQGGSLALRYSEALSSVLPSVNRFVVMVNGRRVYAQGPATLNADGTTILITLATPVASSDGVAVTYGSLNGAEKPGFGDIKSLSTGARAAVFRGIGATNRTDTTPPTAGSKASASVSQPES